MTDQEAINIINNTCCDSEGRVYVNLIKKNDTLHDYLLNRYPDSDSLKETIFRIKNNIEVRPTCIRCGGKVKFDERVSHHYMRNNGYYWHCSGKCAENDKDVRDKIKNTCVERYGAEHNWSKDSNVRYKCEETFAKLYDTQEKRNEILEKRKQTKFERYNDENYNNRDKFRQTNLERYGNEYYFNQEKARETKLLRYGDVEYNNPQKMLETKMERYGTTAVGLDKARKTTFERFGVEYYFQLPDCIKKSHSIEAQLKANHTRCIHGTNRKSTLETLVKDYIATLYPSLKIEENRRKYLDGLEIDIYLPELKFGIEVQGDYFHANPMFYAAENIVNGKTAKEIWGKDEHKLNLANSKGIELMQVWEYDIRQNFDTICEKISEQITARL